MKTTLEIPDAIFRQAKAMAAQQGVPLRQFITEAVEERLRGAAAAREKPWLKLAGQLKHLSKETEQINQVIEREFERIEPEEWA
jgi:hypothetical protein